LSTNNGSSWTSFNELTNQNVQALTVSGTQLFAGTYNSGIYLSSNNGTNWTAVNNGLTTLNVSSFAASGTTLFAGTSGGVFLTTNNGSNWAVVNNGLTNLHIRALAVLGTNLFAGTDTSGVYLSTNNGTNWTAVNNGLTNMGVRSLAVSGTNIFAGTGGGVFLSTNNGTSWINKNQGFGFIPTVYTLLISNNFIFAGTYQHSTYRRSLSEILGVQNISSEVPSGYSLGQNYPNPFNSTSNLKFQISKLGNVKIIVYDVMGREVQTLVNESLQPGTYETKFDGSMLNSGVYFYKLVTDGFTETKRLTLLK
jgi:hypothetical protein